MRNPERVKQAPVLPGLTIARVALCKGQLPERSGYLSPGDRYELSVPGGQMKGVLGRGVGEANTGPGRGSRQDMQGPKVTSVAPARSFEAEPAF